MAKAKATKTATRKKSVGKSAPKKPKKKAAKKSARKPAKQPAKKKVPSQKKSTKSKSVKKVKKKAPIKKAASRKKTVAKVQAEKDGPVKKATRRKVKLARTLGRPLIPADAKLEHVFLKDHQARNVFGFLGVTSVRELESYTPREIVELLTRPVVETVDRIRKTLALNNRALADDRQYAVQFLEEWRRRR